MAEFKIPKFKMQKKIKKKDWRKIIVISTIIIGVFVVFCNYVQMSTAVYYTDTEEYEHLEPYTADECENIQVLYNDTECEYRDYAYSFEQESEFKKGTVGLKQIQYVDVLIRNDENQIGTFTFGYSFSRQSGEAEGEPLTKDIYPQSNESFSFECDCAWIEDITGELAPMNIPEIEECEIVPKSKTEMQCEEMIQYNTSIKYRDVRKKTGEVVYKTLCEQWLGRKCF